MCYIYCIKKNINIMLATTVQTNTYSTQLTNVGTNEAIAIITTCRNTVYVKNYLIHINLTEL
jgi:hypothetical protein